MGRCMPRYFFHVTDSERAFNDQTGEMHPTRQAAEAKAAQLARELAAERETYLDYSVIVADEDGNEIARVPVSPQ
jgi:hypothetical protein